MLWVECLITAIRSAQAGNWRDYIWLYTSHKMQIGSYHWICAVLDLDPDKLRSIPLKDIKVSTGLCFTSENAKKELQASLYQFEHPEKQKRGAPKFQVQWKKSPHYKRMQIRRKTNERK